MPGLACAHRLQLCFGLCATSLFTHLLVRLEPYRDVFCGHVQLAAQLQVLFTYISSTAFYIEPSPAYLTLETGIDDVAVGWGLIMINSICFVFLLWFFVATVRDSVALTAEAQQSFADRIGLERLPRPLTKYADGKQGYHLFISHCWKHAQDQAGTIKHLLRAHYLNLRCFVDVRSERRRTRLKPRPQASA